MPKSRRHILLIESNREVRSAFSLFFREFTDISLQTAEGVAEALGYVSKNLIDLAVFDLGAMTDVRSRLDVVRGWRKAGNLFPIIVTSAQTYDGMMVESLTAGADDFFRKPYLIGEMSARIHRHLTRSISSTIPPRRVDGVTLPTSAFEFAGATVLPDLRIIFPNGREERLSPKQIGILQQLADHAGTLLLKPQLIYAVWGMDANANSNSVNQYLHILRRLYRSGGCDLDQFVTPESKVGWRIANRPLRS